MSALRSMYGSDPSALARGRHDAVRRRRVAQAELEARREPVVRAYRRDDSGEVTIVDHTEPTRGAR